MQLRPYDQEIFNKKQQDLWKRHETINNSTYADTDNK